MKKIRNWFELVSVRSVVGGFIIGFFSFPIVIYAYQFFEIYVFESKIESEVLRKVEQGTLDRDSCDYHLNSGFSFQSDGEKPKEGSFEYQVRKKRQTESLIARVACKSVSGLERIQVHIADPKEKHAEKMASINLSGEPFRKDSGEVRRIARIVHLVEPRLKIGNITIVKEDGTILFDTSRGEPTDADGNPEDE